MASQVLLVITKNSIDCYYQSPRERPVSSGLDGIIKIKLSRVGFLYLLFSPLLLLSLMQLTVECR